MLVLRYAVEMLEPRDLYLLMQPFAGPAERLAQADIETFQYMPFITVPRGAAPPPELPIAGSWRSYPADRLNFIRGLDWCLERKAWVVNISLGVRAQPFDPSDPLQIATKTAHAKNTVVIVAVGNGGPGCGTLQPLAQAPWVIAVGATDVDGRLLRSSSRGSRNGPHPTVVADGQPLFVDGSDGAWAPGTSFAAPEVSAIAAWTLVCLDRIRGDLYAQQNGQWWTEAGMPMPMTRELAFPIVGHLDSGLPPERFFPPFIDDPLVRQSIYGITFEDEPGPGDVGKWHMARGMNGIRLYRTKEQYAWYAELVNGLARLCGPFALGVSTLAVRRTIQQMARPLAEYQPCEVGSGFVSKNLAIEFFSSFTASKFLSIFFPQALYKVESHALSQLDEQLGYLWDQTDIKALVNFFYGAFWPLYADIMGHRLGVVR
jgi:hypothetical protein